MRRVLMASIFGVLLAALPAGQSGSDPGSLSDSLERPFAPGGAIHMSLSAGDYHISGSKEPRLRVLWKVRNAEDLPRVRVKADVRDPRRRSPPMASGTGLKSKFRSPRDRAFTCASPPAI